MTTLGKPAPNERQYVRIRDYYTGKTIYHADALHPDWELEVQRYLGYRADIVREETEDGFDVILADDKAVGYIGEHRDLPMCAQREAAE